MVQASDLAPSATSGIPEISAPPFQLPSADDDSISDVEFHQQVTVAWQICHRFDLQTDIWRGQILKAVRDRESRRGEGRGSGFLNWLKDHEISKSQAYRLIELADSADAVFEEGWLQPEDVNQFSKQAFMEAAQASPEVRQLVSEAAQRGDRITRQGVRQLSDDWSAMTSELVPDALRQKVASDVIPTRYVGPLVKELEKLPEAHQSALQDELKESPDLDTLKQVTADARSLAKYLSAAEQVQAIRDTVDMEAALDEAFRVGCLTAVADMVQQAGQLEQAIAKVYTTWKRVTQLSERAYVDSGASTPNLRSLLAHLEPLTGETVEIHLGEPDGGFFRQVRLTIDDET
ncbi:MAG: hypothetical protein AAF289_05550 [Cyanobacteria bacterium P01_A01_bin.135]